MTRYDGFEVWFQSICDAHDLGQFLEPCDIDPPRKPATHCTEILPWITENRPQEFLEQVGVVQRGVDLCELVEDAPVLANELLPGTEQDPLLQLQGAPHFIDRGSREDPPAKLVESFVHPLDDVESVEDVDRLGQPRGDHGLVAQVADRTSDPTSSLGSESLQ